MKERLDRVLCSMDWRIMFPGAEVFALPAVGSDHSPLILETSAHSKRHKKPFHYEAYWNDDAECREVISTAWNSISHQHPAFLSNLKTVTTALSKWSHEKFSNGHARVIALQHQLQDLMNHQHLNYNREAA